MTVEEIAKVCHEVNRALCAAFGDYSQLPWAEAPEWQRDSAIKGVLFRIDNPDVPPWAQHNAWMTEKYGDGWKYGPVKNPETKEHPCLVSYGALPPEQRAKDHIFIAIVNELSGDLS